VKRKRNVLFKAALNREKDGQDKEKEVTKVVEVGRVRGFRNVKKPGRQIGTRGTMRHVRVGSSVCRRPRGGKVPSGGGGKKHYSPNIVQKVVTQGKGGRTGSEKRK